jgi:Zn-dependent metalloprotease
MAAFKTFSMHATERDGKTAFAALKTERADYASFGGPGPSQMQLDPETAARRIVEQALDSDSVPSFTVSEAKGKKPELKSLGTETQPLTGTRIVKFRQFYNKVPVYSSLITVELDEKNECVSINSTLAEPGGVNTVAKKSPDEALKVVAKAAGYGKSVPSSPPRLYIYLDDKGKWRLVYIIEDVRTKPSKQKQAPAKAAKGRSKEADYARSSHHHADPVVFDYVVDANTGSLVAQLPRTPGVSESISSPDDMGKMRQIEVDRNGASIRLMDATLGIETYDFHFKDPDVRNGQLPGDLVTKPPALSTAAVSAHANASDVARFLRQTLMRNNIDNAGGRMVSSVNCVIKARAQPPGSQQWFNAFWDPDRRQMVYGQVAFNGALRTIAANLDVVAHEMFHGVTNDTSRLEYKNMSGALNESYSDIFGIIVSNLDNPAIDSWNWLLGEGLSDSREAFRDFSDPPRFRQPKHMRDFVNTIDDHGGVHTNSGIHNFAAFSIMTSRAQNGSFHFTAQDLAKMFYISLTQQLTRQSGFSDSRRGVLLAARSLFRALAPADLNVKVRAIEKGFDAAGIA